MRTRTLLTATLAVPLAAASVLVVAPGAAAATGPAYGVTWIVDTAANSISAYPAGASGASTPVVTIAGAATGLSAPSAVQVSPSGIVYVANAGNSSITEYRNGASGNVAPHATIAGPATGLDAPSSLDLAGGEVWVTDPSTNVVEGFTAGSSGNELPAESISGSNTGLNHPIAVAVDRSLEGADGAILGGLGLAGVYVINAPTSGGGSVTAYAAGKFGDRAPVATVGSALHPLASPSAILSVDIGEIWVASRGADSASEYFVFPGEPSEAIRTIKGTKTGIDAPDGLSLDARSDLVVANSGSHSLGLFGPTAHGNVAPVRTVTDVGSDAGTPADAAVYGAAPGAPTGLKVALHRRKTSDGSSAKLSWHGPAVDGGGLIGYEVVGLDETSETEVGGSGGDVSVVSGGALGGLDVTTTKTTYPEHHLKLGHRYLFAVVAVNGFGSSHASNIATAALPIPPSAPQDVEATSSTRSIAVHWKAPKKDGGDPIRSYRVEYATCVPGAKGCVSHSRTVSAHVNHLTIHGLKAATTYDVRVAAKTKKGLGALSKVTKATTGG
jgi:Fibronectin type III domain